MALFALAAHAAEEPTVAYKVSITGLDRQPDLRDKLQAASVLVSRADRPPPSQVALDARVREDVGRLREVLRSEGYYGARLVPRIDRDKQPVQVVLNVAPGPLFHLTSYRIEYRTEAKGARREPPPHAARGPGDVGVRLGMPAKADELLAAEKKIVARLEEHGFPYPEIAERHYVANHANATFTAELVVATGRPARFGRLAFRGLKTVEQDYLRRIIDWHEGIPYDSRVVSKLRETLGGTTLFSRIVVHMPKPVPANGVLPVSVELQEGKHRTIAGGISWSTDLGPGATASWEHRNLLGQGEDLKLSADLSLVRQSLIADIRKPAFLERKQTLHGVLSGLKEKVHGLDQTTIAEQFGIERPLLPHLTGSAAQAVELSEIRDFRSRTTVLLVGLPLGLVWDDRDNLLNPTKGVYASLVTTPWATVMGRGSEFLVNDIRASTYWDVLDDGRAVLAGRVRFGTILGGRIEDIPATHRFYAGGGGSIRGYEYQRVGPLDPAHEPTGGRSVIETSLEARVKVYGDFGIVPFIDGGQVFDGILPGFDLPLQWGAGLGLRYYTGFGPIRLDVATPINPRRGVDPSYQIYVSIGQAF